MNPYRIKKILRGQRYRRHRYAARVVPFAREMLRALLAATLIFIALLFLIAFSSPAHAFPFGSISKGIRIASSATDLAKKYRKIPRGHVYTYAAKDCTTDADCCEKNPHLCLAQCDSRQDCCEKFPNLCYPGMPE